MKYDDFLHSKIEVAPVIGSSRFRLGNELVVYLDTSAVVCAYLSEKG